MTSPILEELKEAKKKIRALETELSRVIADREIALARVAELEDIIVKAEGKSARMWAVQTPHSEHFTLKSWCSQCESLRIATDSPSEAREREAR